MRDTLKNPCRECPFRKNSLPGWLGPWDAEGLHNFVMQQEGDFACHMSIPEGIDDPDMLIDITSRCAGSILYLIRNCKLPHRIDLREVIDDFRELPDLQEKLEKIMWSPEFKKHHKFIAE